MKKFESIIFLLVLFGTFHFSCKKNKDYYNPRLFIKTIVVDGAERRYAVYVPENIENTNPPLVFALHGGSGNIENMTGESNYAAPFKIWMNIADTAKLIIVYPEGLNGTSGNPVWNDCRADCTVNSDANDVGFISALINLINTEYNIDTTRVFATGFSNGGIMSLRLAVELPDKITAVATIGAAMPAVSKCENPGYPVSVLLMNGTADKFLPFEGGTIGNPPKAEHGSILSAEESINIWVNLNKTDTVPSIYLFPDKDTDDGSIVEKFSYKNGLNGTEVVFYKINGGGHLAPSLSEQYSGLTEQIFGKQNHDIEMATEVWNFFKGKKL